MDSTEETRREDPLDDYQPSLGLVHGIAGVLLLVLGGLLLATIPANQSPELTRAAGLALVGTGAYLTIAGAVVRGVQISRR